MTSERNMLKSYARQNCVTFVRLQADPPPPIGGSIGILGIPIIPGFIIPGNILGIMPGGKPRKCGYAPLTCFLRKSALDPDASRIATISSIAKTDNVGQLNICLCLIGTDRDCERQAHRLRLGP